MEKTEVLTGIKPVRKHVDVKGKLRTYTMVFALLAIWGIFQYATGGAFLEPRNLSNLLRQMSVTGILAVGMVLIIVARHIDLSVGSVVCFLGAIMAILTTNHGVSPGLAVLITMAAGLLIGVFQGYLASYQGVPSFIVTLGGMMAFRGASMWITSNSTIPLQENWILGTGTAYLDARWGWVLTAVGVLFMGYTMLRRHQASIKYGFDAGSMGSLAIKIGGYSALLVGFMSVMGSYQGIPVPVLIMLALMLAIDFAATKTTWGRHVYAIGGNIDAARLSGINVRFKTLAVFMLMGVLSAIGGVVLTARVGSASPDAGQLLELDAIASCVIGGTSLLGGKGSIPGALLGALVMESLNNGMSLANIEPFWQYVVKGLVLVTAVWADIVSQDRE